MNVGRTSQDSRYMHRVALDTVAKPLSPTKYHPVTGTHHPTVHGCRWHQQRALKQRHWSAFEIFLSLLCRAADASLFHVENVKLIYSIVVLLLYL